MQRRKMLIIDDNSMIRTDMTYFNLENDSKSRVMFPKFRKTLCDKVQGIIASGKSRPLAAQEEQ